MEHIWTKGRPSFRLGCGLQTTIPTHKSVDLPTNLRLLVQRKLTGPEAWRHSRSSHADVEFEKICCIFVNAYICIGFRPRLYCRFQSSRLCKFRLWWYARGSWAWSSSFLLGLFRAWLVEVKSLCRFAHTHRRRDQTRRLKPSITPTLKTRQRKSSQSNLIITPWRECPDQNLEIKAVKHTRDQPQWKYIKSALVVFMIVVLPEGFSVVKVVALGVYVRCSFNRIISNSHCRCNTSDRRRSSSSTSGGNSSRNSTGVSTVAGTIDNSCPSMT